MTRDQLGMAPWMSGWGSWKTPDPQVLVRPPAVVTRGIHMQKGCRTTSNCTPGVAGLYVDIGVRHAHRWDSEVGKQLTEDVLLFTRAAIADFLLCKRVKTHTYVCCGKCNAPGMASVCTVFVWPLPLLCFLLS
ncbi:uncharacterized protein PGTG_01393 [Puccinia graminis f. sp. tritici CRL 75-36-700-3]|uniref:Uncharacterized protein n=1 Tax=Puccinia graminis f. sp. tritici (strain CRL 75-36-700-3 / race SCCL) TaxID=418459 RepID=E3JRX5_PUCGT|nr:uncharacterized protein PGTG_01393 [Puccinia graminis f. sp. tritici CRL 75-36-700-3]EFP74800.2 hypothetical protein PGTG_01393 [Puccinia graminis f. sp. tritici CRL 75-36-700-3]